MTAKEGLTVCGVGFEHDGHLTRAQSGKVLACDGHLRATKQAEREAARAADRAARDERESA